MSAQRFIAEFDRLAEAPNALPRLRQFVFDLAVRGKLGEVQPESWTNCTLADVGRWGSGGTPRKGHSEYYGGDIPWLVIGDLNEGIVTQAETHITQAGLENSSAKIVEPGTVLIAMYGSIGKLGLAGIRCATNQAIAFCAPDANAITAEYLMIALRSLRAEFIGRGHGVAQQNISQTILKAHPLPLPPLVEQRRIVAKVDELMALCDRLEAAQLERERRRDRLAAAATNEPVGERTAFLLNHLNHVVTRLELVVAVEALVLEAAVRGQLVQQDASESAVNYDELASRLPPKRQAVGRTGANLGPVSFEESGFTLPPTWRWSRMYQVCRSDAPIVYGILQPGPDVRPAGIPYVRPSEIENGQIVLSDVRHTEPSIAANYARSRIEKDDILLTIVGTIGNTAKVPRELHGGNITQSSCRLRPDSQLVDGEYLQLALTSPFMHSQYEKFRLGTAVPRLNIAHVRALAVPLPPISEQKRIVARVQRIRSICGGLRAALAAKNGNSRRLLQVRLEMALSGGE